MFLNSLRRKVFKKLEFLWWQYVYMLGPGYLTIFVQKFKDGAGLPHLILEQPKGMLCTLGGRESF